LHSRSIGGVINNQLWMCACVALMAATAVAGCGGGGASTSSGTSGAAGTLPATTSTTSTVAGQATPDDVYQACLGALKGAVADKAAQNACSQVRDAFQQCTTAASNAPEGSARDAAVRACQQAADRATSQLESSP
jgi:hypothetical protein